MLSDAWNSRYISKHLTKARVSSGSCVTFHMIATDRLWGVGTYSKDRTTP